MGNGYETAVDRRSLKDKLAAIILLESSKDYREMDSDLVAECVDFLMELEGKQRLSKKEIEQRVKAIPFKGKATAINSYAKKKIRAKRLAVTAAMLAVLLAIFSIVAVSLGTAEDSLVGRFANYIGEIMKSGDHKDFESIELIKHDKSIFFSSVEELAEHENIEILFPDWMPKNNKINEISYYCEDTMGEFYVLYCGNPAYSISIDINKTVSEDVKLVNSFQKVGKHIVYIVSTDGCTQGMFDYNNCCYTVSAYTEEEIFRIIENLKEIS